MTGAVDMNRNTRKRHVTEVAGYLRFAAVAFESLPLADQEELERRAPGDSFARLMKEAKQYGKEI